MYMLLVEYWQVNLALHKHPAGDGALKPFKFVLGSGYALAVNQL